jgi:hypothetical protein
LFFLESTEPHCRQISSSSPDGRSSSGSSPVVAEALCRRISVAVAFLPFPELQSRPSMAFGNGRASDPKPPLGGLPTRSPRPLPSLSALSPERVADARDRADSVDGGEAHIGDVGFCSAPDILYSGSTPQGGGAEVGSSAIWLMPVQWCFGFGFLVGGGFVYGYLSGWVFWQLQFAVFRWVRCLCLPMGWVSCNRLDYGSARMEIVGFRPVCLVQPDSILPVYVF